LRLLWFVLGWFCLATGVAGMALPLVPTTPLVLAAAFCFARSSTRFHQWLLGHPTFGPMIANWQNERAIALGAKVWATVAIALALALSAALRLDARLLLVQGAVLIAVLVFIWSRRTASRYRAPAGAARTVPQSGENAMSDDERAVRVRVTGRVQGVYFRGWTLEQAERLHLSGWVRNEADGSVAALVVGRRVDVDELLHAMRSGPPGAEVGEVSVQDVTPESRPEGFAVAG
jgi:uncharacterized membrane protein YbaN (DUF454 family)/acylphosphatase